MLIELGLGAGAIGLFLARKTKPVKFLTGRIKNFVVKTKTGQSIILSNAKSSIKEEFDREVHSLQEDSLNLDMEIREMNKKQEYLNFLQFALEDPSTSEEERIQYKKEMQNKTLDLKVISEAIETKKILIKERSSKLKNYEENILDKRVTEAEIAEVVFRQQHELDSLQSKLDKEIGKDTLTSNVVNRWSTSFDSNVISQQRKYELLERYKKEKND